MLKVEDGSLRLSRNLHQITIMISVKVLTFSMQEWERVTRVAIVPRALLVGDEES